MIDTVWNVLGFILVSFMSLGAFFMCYIIINDWFINSKKKEKIKDEKFSLSSLIRLIFYFAAGCYFAWVILFLELEIIK
tara:strand:- start:389 stop:625 length:237 start_codon:yes stop_codon:yes gene_type:complete